MWNLWWTKWLERVFYPSTSVFSCQYHPTNQPHSFIYQGRCINSANGSVAEQITYKINNEAIKDEVTDGTEMYSSVTTMNFDPDDGKNKKKFEMLFLIVVAQVWFVFVFFFRENL